MDVATAIREARRGCGLSQAEVARRMGACRHAVLALEQGIGSVETLEAVAKVLNFRLTGGAAGDTVGDQLLAARERRRWSQGTVAAQSGLTVPTIRSLERGGGSIRSLTAALRVLAPAARANAVFRAHYRIRDDVRFTPPDFLAGVTAAFGPFSTDVAGDLRSFVEADRIITIEEDGLTARWSGRLAWCNPPFSKLSTWITRCADAWDRREVEALVALFPARTELVAYRTRVVGTADVLFLPRRLRFFDADRQQLPPAPFPLMLCTWGVRREQVLNYAVRADRP